MPPVKVMALARVTPSPERPPVIAPLLMTVSCEPTMPAPPAPGLPLMPSGATPLPPLPPLPPVTVPELISVAPAVVNWMPTPPSRARRH